MSWIQLYSNLEKSCPRRLYTALVLRPSLPPFYFYLALGRSLVSVLSNADIVIHVPKEAFRHIAQLTLALAMVLLRVYVAQYDNGGGVNGRLPYHWRLVIQNGFANGEPIGHVFYVSGSPAMGYKFRSCPYVRYQATSRYRGRVQVGTVNASDAAAVEYQLGLAEIRDRDPTWSDQNWVYGAIRRLVAQRFQGIAYWSMDNLVTNLKGAEEAWERMED